MMDREQIDSERYQLNKMESWAVSVLRSIHCMQRDIAYVDGKIAEQDKLGPILSIQKEVMLDGIDALSYYCGFELVRLEESDAEENK